MGPRTWRDRLREWWFDARHPLRTVERELAVRFCTRHNLVMVPANEFRR